MSLYSARGFHEVYLGDEAIIPCDRFTLQGSAKKSVRAAVKRVGRDHRFRLMRESDASPQLVEELNKIRERWRGKAPERGFTMELGGGVRGQNPDFLLAVAFESESERPDGFLRLVPCYGDDPGWSLDLMQRDPDAPNGMTEFLIANAALALGERGFTKLSMNFAAWGRLFDAGAQLTLSQRALKKVGRGAQPVLPDQVAAGLQREVRPGLGAAGDHGRGGLADAQGRAALRERRGLREPAAGRAQARGALSRRRARRAPAPPP